MHPNPRNTNHPWGTSATPKESQGIEFLTWKQIPQNKKPSENYIGLTTAPTEWTKGPQPLKNILNITKIKQSKNWIWFPSCGLQHLRNRPVLQKHSRGRHPSNAVSPHGWVFISPDSSSAWNDLSQEKRNSILWDCMRRRTRRYEQRGGMSHRELVLAKYTCRAHTGQRRGPSFKSQANSRKDWTQKERGKGASARSVFATKWGKYYTTRSSPTEDTLREGLELPNPLGSGESNQEQNLLGQGPQTEALQRLVSQRHKVAQYDVQVPRRRQMRTMRSLNSKRQNQVPKDMMIPKLRTLKQKNRREHGAVGLDRRNQ